MATPVRFINRGQELQYPEYLTSREIIDEMRAIAPAGQCELDPKTIDTLSYLTGQLIDVDGLPARAEYSRYVNTRQRGLGLPHGQLYAQHAGKTILVSGGTGLIGSTLMSELSALNPGRLVSLSRGVTGPQQIVPDAEYAHGDVRDAEAVRKLMFDLKPDIVYHLAADKYNHEAEKRAHHTLSTNVLGTQNMIDSAEAAGVEHFIYASTGKATRPFSPDIYASSKKTGEWLISKAAKNGNTLYSGGRFTHVVDNSSLLKKLNGWIDNGEPVRLHNPDTWFYVQSARESAHLLMNSGLEARAKELRLHSIRDLGIPIHLGRFGLGAIVKSSSRVPIYFQGVEEGYEEKAWGGLYHPETAGDVGPMISSLEADSALPSDTCAEVDSFPLALNETDDLSHDFEALSNALHANASGESLREINHRLSWTMLDARLDMLSDKLLARTRKHIAMFSTLESQSPEHSMVNSAVTRALDKRL